MYQPEDNDPIEQTNNVNAEGSAPDNTDRVNGEYHYKNGFTQKIYSDAHYVPADESNDPPRYYAPPEKQEKPQREPKPSDNGGPASHLCARCSAVSAAARSPKAA